MSMREREPRAEKLAQTTDTVLMIYPDTFYFNPETASSNKFMKPLPKDLTPEQIRAFAIDEFETAVDALQKAGAEVLVIHGPDGIDCPDGVFPNNWMSHNGDELIIYPMRNQSRSVERQPEKIAGALKRAGFVVPRIVDLSYHEAIREPEILADGSEVSVCTEALEGTGSMVLDRINKITYAIESPRTTKMVFDEWCDFMGYQGVFFHASDGNDDAIYHTNVIMGIGKKFVVISLESIKDENERKMVEQSLKIAGREVIDITLDQVSTFCGNLLEIKSKNGEPLIVMSELARNNFTKEQLAILESYGKIVAFDIPIIEHAGGSARCIMAEIYHT